MASVEAQKAKERGNIAFKRGDYPEAIGQYSAAILADRSDPTYPLNRAAAYLKLGKNEDAARDCTTALRLKPGNVKALYRRAQAQTELGKLSDAREDLQQALKLEPNNESVKTELARVAEILAKSKVSKQPKIAATKPAPNKTHLSPRKGRRVPILPIEGETISEKAPPQPVASTSTRNEPLKAISTHNLSPSPILLSTTPITNAPAVSSYNDPLKPISTRKISRSASTEATPPTSTPITDVSGAETPPVAPVRGGIFRSSGEHTLFNASSAIPVPPNPPSEVPTVTARSRSANTNGTDKEGRHRLSYSPSLFDFTMAWSSTEDPSDKWRLFSRIPPQHLPTMFKVSLETSGLTSILDVFSHAMRADNTTAAQVKEYMLWLRKVPRFEIVTMFLDEREQAVAKEVVDKLGGVDGWSL